MKLVLKVWLLLGPMLLTASTPKSAESLERFVKRQRVCLLVLSLLSVGGWYVPLMAQEVTPSNRTSGQAEEQRAPDSPDTAAPGEPIAAAGPPPQRFPQPQVVRVSPRKAGLRDTVSIVLTGLDSLRTDPEGTVIDPNSLILYLDGRPIADLHPETVDAESGRLTFKLQRTAASRETWNNLLGRPGFKTTKRVRIGVGLPDGPEFRHSTPELPATLSLIVFSTGGGLLFALTLLISIGGFVFLARTTNIIRDTVPPDPRSGEKRPYSLGRTQMALWIFVILGSFIFILLITGEYNHVITEQALILMGIGIGTALGSSAIENSKQDQVYEEIRKLAPQAAGLQAKIAEDSLLAAKWAELQDRLTPQNQVVYEEIRNFAPQAAGLQATIAQNPLLAEQWAKLVDLQERLKLAQKSLSQPISEKFVKDLVSDVHGASLHRFQIIAWTFVLAAIFVHGVWATLALPELDATLLGLMGISAGTYLGFKLPERQVETT